jgi:hypothetical protein
VHEERRERIREEGSVSKMDKGRKADRVMNDEGERIIEEERNMEDGLGKKQGKDHGRRRRVKYKEKRGRIR